MTLNFIKCITKIKCVNVLFYSIYVNSVLILDIKRRRDDNNKVITDYGSGGLKL